MASLDSMEAVVREKIERDRWTYQKLSSHLQQLYPGLKGFSVSSLKRFCNSRNIHKTSRLSSAQVDVVVAGSVAKVSQKIWSTYCFWRGEVHRRESQMGSKLIMHLCINIMPHYSPYGHRWGKVGICHCHGY